MKRLLSILFCAFCGGSIALAQFGNFGDKPIEIEADSNQGFEGGVGRAEGNVTIAYGDTIIHSDYAEYNSDTRDVFLQGNVRIYRNGTPLTADRGIYNLETKRFSTANFRSDLFPMRFFGDSLGSLGPNEYKVQNGSFTTSDSSAPDYQIQARTVRIYPKNRIILRDVTFRVGRVPILYFPYIYQPLDNDFGFQLTPGYTSRWGAFMLTYFGFPISEATQGRLLLDYRQKRGAGIGLETKSDFGGGSWANFRSYYAKDNSTDINPTSLERDPVGSDRYRVSLQSRLYLTEDLYTTIDLNKLSDKNYLEDFELREYRVNPQPDNVAAITQWSENYTATLMGRFAFNSFFETTERLPELVLDAKRTPVLGSRVFYEGQTGIAQLRRNFANDSINPDYDALRFDSFHQLLLPNTYFGWLSFVPRVGARATYYDRTGNAADALALQNFAAFGQDDSSYKYSKSDPSEELSFGGSTLRPAFNAGFESSFKFSREFSSLQSRAWGLDGMRHVVQPYTNFSFVWTGEDNNILPFDRYIPSTQLAPIDMTGFTAVDSLTNWTVWRFGMRNRLQTRRDDQTLNWLELDSFFDFNIDAPEFPGVLSQGGNLSNLFNNLRWRPLPWVSLNLDSQVPLTAQGFTQINTHANFMASSDLMLSVGHRYIAGNPYFTNSSLAEIGGYYRINDNWGLSVRERYEFTDSVLESQRYSIHRDLSSWVASLGVIINNNGGGSEKEGKNEYGVVLSFTLKDLPQATIPFSFDPQGSEESSR